MKKLIITCAVLFACTCSYAYPITPRPLRLLISESEYIVMGKVIRTGTEKVIEKKYSWDHDFAVIAIQEVLQGDIKSDSIRVYYTAGMICPAPARYEEGFYVVTFLDKTKKGTYTTHALSYGSKLFATTEGLEVYKARINEMQKIQQIKNEQEKFDSTVNWLVNCALNSYTRWEGTYELSPVSDFMSYYDWGGGRNFQISAGQQQKLFEKLMQTDTLGYLDMGLVDLAWTVDQPQLLRYLKGQLMIADTSYLFQAKSIMERIARLTSSELLQSIVKEINEVMWNEKPKAIRLYQRFVEAMKDAEKAGCVWDRK